MSNKTELQANNLELQGILNSVNALPNVGGGIETWQLKITGASNFTGDSIYIPYVGESGQLEFMWGYEVLSMSGEDPLVLNVPKNAILYLRANFEDTGEMSNVSDSMGIFNDTYWFKLLGDTELERG